MPGPRAPLIRLRLALSNEALKITRRPSRWPSSASAEPTRTLSSSDSTTQGPAMRNGAANRGGMGSVPDGELGRRGGRLIRGALPAMLQRRLDEAGEQGMGPGRPGLQLGMELAADIPRVIGQLDHLDQ